MRCAARTHVLMLLSLLLLAAPPLLRAQEHSTPHTYRATPASPKATLADIAWLEGAWEGPAFGGISEEIWSEPLGHTMMGVYRSVESGAVKFYEINSIVETGGSLEMRLKHFHPDLTGWEDKDTVRRFPLVRLTADELCFEGMTYRHTGKDSLTVFLAVENKDGTVHEVSFDYHRRP